MLVAIWAAASRLAASPLLPGPLDVARSLAAAAAAGTLVRAVVTSALRLLVGYAIAIVTGVPLGLMLARSDATKRALGPLLLGDFFIADGSHGVEVRNGGGVRASPRGWLANKRDSARPFGGA